MAIPTHQAFTRSCIDGAWLTGLLWPHRDLLDSQRLHLKIAKCMQAAKAMINEEALGSINLQAATAGSIASLLTVSLINPSPTLARFKGENERMWAQSIQADINNGAPAKAICINASSSA